VTGKSRKEVRTRQTEYLMMFKQRGGVFSDMLNLQQSLVAMACV